MGSKGVLLGGVALIVGIYSTGIHKADVIIANSAGTRVYQLQSDANARTGLRLALNDMRDNTTWSVTRRTVIFLGDTIWYDVDNTQTFSPKKSTIRAGSKYKGIETEITAYAEESSAIVNRRGRRIGYNWAITKTYVKQSTESIITQ